MLHMGPDKVTRGKRAAETQLARQHAGGDNAREAAGVLAGAGGVRAADAEHVEHGGLGLQDGAAAEGADFDRGHGDGDLEGAAEAVNC